MKPPSFIERFREFILKINQLDDSRLLVNALEKFYQENDLGFSLNKTTEIPCPMICLFCEHFINEPLTLHCGHTFCEHCVLKHEFQSTKHCPRCLNHIQGHIPSPMEYARTKSFSKNCFLNEIFQRSPTLKYIQQNSSLCNQAENELEKQNYLRASEIYSSVLENFDDHYASYGRAKAYFGLREFDKALFDIERTTSIKPQWAKGHYLRSEILFELKRYTPALLATLYGLTLDPKNSCGQQLLSKYIPAVLFECDEHEIETDLKLFSENNNYSKENSNSIESSENQLNVCKSKSSLCFCSLFDVKNMRCRDFDCSICANLLWCPVTTPCGHTFCRECLIRSIDNTQTQCPLCKYQLNEFFSMLIQSYVAQTEIISQMIESYFPKECNEREQLHEKENVQGSLIPKDLVDADESSIFEVPIFVCVLALPHSTCPLHVFEPRYRLMMRRTIETNSRTFGMCKYQENTETFSDFGTLLYIRGLIYTQDGRSIVDTVGQRRFRVVERDQRDGYDTARVQLIRDDPINDETEFNELHQMNRTTYERVRAWFNQLDLYRRTLISRQLQDYPTCDDLTQRSADGPVWAWIMLNVLPIEPDLQYNVLMSQSFRTRLRIINETIDFLLNFRRQQRQHHYHHHHQQSQQQNQQQTQQITEEESLTSSNNP